MAQERASFWKRHHRLVFVVGSLLLVLLALAVAVAILARQTEPFLRARIVAGLEDRFRAHVELDSFHISLSEGLLAEGKGLRIWPPAEVGGLSGSVSGPGTGDPLIRLDEFRFHAPLRYQPGIPIHVHTVELKGLAINLPPKSRFGKAAFAVSKPVSPSQIRFEIEQIECNNASLVLLTDKPGKLPLEFAIAHLKLTNVASGGAMSYDAELTNPKPVGTIRATGSFGPWQVQDPGESPINGFYRFDHADLSNFKGIAGILASTGRFEGTLRNLTVDGETSTPDFRLAQFDHRLALNTRFHAYVDATNGDTTLDPVDATLGHSHFTARGPIIRVPANQSPAGLAPGAPSRGRDIALNVIVDRAWIEDFLYLASRSTSPLLTGNVAVKAALHIPPGPQTVLERMTLAGAFTLDQAQFTSEKIQGRIRELSLRGQGRPQDVKTTDSATVRSHMEGRFQLANSTVTLPALGYTVPGAEIQLKGSYGLAGGALNFDGTARMQATVSQMVGGWKGLLLKPADRFFQKDGTGTSIPIHIKGTRDDPQFGIDFGRLR